MSKYIKTIPRGRIARIAIVPGRGRTLEQVMMAEAVPPDYGINGGLYNPNGTPAAHLKINGKVLAKETWEDWGMAWDTGPDIKMVQVPPGGVTPYQNHITCKALLTPWDGIDAPLDVPENMRGARGWTALALTGDKLISLSTSDGKDSMTLLMLRKTLYEMGAEVILVLDSGQSVKARNKDGSLYINDKDRDKVNNYILFWLLPEEEEEKPMETPVEKTVCIDRGHDPSSTNGAPDGSYKEYEFAWDMGGRVTAHLERCKVKVVHTRKSVDEVKGLTARAAVSNNAGCDVFLSMHSNAPGSASIGKDGWCESVRGLLIFTSKAGADAGRNKLAGCILAQMKAAGVKLCDDGLQHYGYTVLTKTVAPANIIEFGFHTNRADVALLKDPAYRAKLAEATAKGVCDYLGIPWQADKPQEPEKPWYAEAQAWAIAQGISDGSKPDGTCTRAEVWEMLRRLKM